jgi:isopentenyldiphosphate isomerase
MRWRGEPKKSSASTSPASTSCSPTSATWPWGAPPSGVVENEICPVFTARAASELRPNPDEVAEWHWADVDALAAAVELTPWAYSPWLTLQLPQLMPQLQQP